MVGGLGIGWFGFQRLSAPAKKGGKRTGVLSSHRIYVYYIYISLIRSNFILFIFGGAHFCVQLCSLLVGVIVIHVFFWGTISETVGNTFVAKHHLRIEGRNPKSISSAC